MPNYFSEKEQKCKCGKCDGLLDKEFLDRLNQLREQLGRPVLLSSAYRCPAHNSVVSRTGKHGPHTTGKAVDIVCAGSEAVEILDIALDLEFKGIGVCQTGTWGRRFIHIDDARPTATIWSY